MLRTAMNLIGLRILATDGELGRVVDIYFDDHTWRVRYLVAALETPGPREVLLAPATLLAPDWQKNVLPVTLTVEQVQASPNVSADLPVSRSQEAQLALYYAWAPWWEMSVPLAGGPLAPLARARQDASDTPVGDPDLRSVEDLATYYIEASDGPIGRVEDFIIQTDQWAVRYLVARTRKWLPGRRILISPAWLKDVDWDSQRVRVDLTREEIRHSPEFNPTRLLDRDYESKLHDHYARPKYWEPPTP